MKVRLIVTAVVTGALLMVGAAPALAKHHRSVGMRFSTKAPLHSLKLNSHNTPPAGGQEGPITPLAQGYTCKVFVGFATANHPREATTVDSETNGSIFSDAAGGFGGVLLSTCQGQLPLSQVHTPGTFESQCFQPNFFPSGGATISGHSETVVFPDGQYIGTCETVRDPFH